MSFESLGLLPELLRAVREKGYEVPTSIQSQAIPTILQGRDVLGGSQTGTGKTAAFTLPLLQRLNKPVTGRKPVRALVLTPTRELALQVEESVRDYGKYLKLTSTTIFGGVNVNPQIRTLKAGVDIVVATPGRLLDHHEQGTIDFSKIEFLILDEADRMLDMGFIRDIRKILALLPAKRQNLLFSATYNDEIRTLAEGLLKDPVSIDVAPRNSGVQLITHVVHPVDRVRKTDLLIHLAKTLNLRQALVFTRTKHMANNVAEALNEVGVTAMAIHGNKSQPKRVQALSDFKSGRIRILVATDIAARGLDIVDLPHVVNFELPYVAEDFVHRTGRTGRNGAEGDAIALVCVDENHLLRDIERLMKTKLPVEVIPGFAPDPSIKAEPLTKTRRSEGHRGGGRGQRPQGQSQQKPAQPREPRTQEARSPRPQENRPQPQRQQAPRQPQQNGRQGQSPRQPHQDQRPPRPPRSEPRPEPRSEPSRSPQSRPNLASSTRDAIFEAIGRKPRR
jgi:ATP-dependent RNA helicase RhlE